jgi:hypothetical protein
MLIIFFSSSILLLIFDYLKTCFWPHARFSFTHLPTYILLAYAPKGPTFCSTYLPIRPPTHPPIQPPTNPAIYLPTHLATFLPTHATPYFLKLFVKKTLLCLFKSTRSSSFSRLVITWGGGGNWPHPKCENSEENKQLWKSQSCQCKLWCYFYNL